MSSSGTREWLLLAVLVVDAVLLAVLQLFFLPMRLDGRVLPAAGDLPVPVVVVLAMVTTPLLVAQAARCAAALGRTPLLAGLPLLAWLVALLLLAVGGPGGDQVFLPDWRTAVLLAGGALPGAFALGRALGSGKAGARRDGSRAAPTASTGPSSAATPGAQAQRAGAGE
ncbi:hypothetical protein [Haloechinothrix sp. LS1_15]|uniref:hypothetical protein n=1 Tax=Haloechinothrix sp. LS1_15 TaxID=2652248 RepID=UPI00294B0531|nr:hypothetical protein [Haloechinothrix sp. LS1_15]